jgi:hypothetical protein
MQLDFAADHDCTFFQFYWCVHFLDYVFICSHVRMRVYVCVIFATIGGHSLL